MNQKIIVTLMEKELQRRMGKGYEFKLQDIWKFNDIGYTGMTVNKEGCHVSPVYNFGRYAGRITAGERIETVVDEIITDFEGSQIELQEGYDLFDDFSRIEKRIRFKFCKKEWNTHYIQDKAYRDFLDFAVLYYLDVRDLFPGQDGYAEIMMDGLVRQEDMRGFSHRIYNEASRMITLIGDIIRLSKLDEGTIELEKEDVDLYRLIRDIVSRLSVQAEKQNVRIEVVGEHVTFHGIRQVLDEMLYNIIENAVKYNVPNGKVSVWVGNTLNGKKVIVNDTGIGIPKEHQDRIFERFYRVDKSHSRETGGTGLGLSIVKHGALLHGADIHVESEVGKGTRMELIFHEEQNTSECT